MDYKLDVPTLQALVREWDKQPFLYHYMLPLVGFFFFAKILFASFMSLPSMSLQRWFKQVEPHKEKDIHASMFYCLCLILSVIIGEATTGHEGWRTDYYECYRGWPQDQKHSWGLKFYYTFTISFYLYSIVLIFFEEKKKDFVAMLVHHLVTLTTLTLSGYIEHYRIGVVICLLFDFCDILLELAKILNKCKADLSATIAFTAFVLAWVRNRLFLFPMYIIPSIINAEELSNHEIPFHKLHCIIMVVLMVLQIYWSYFIFKKLVGFITNGISSNGGDPRDHGDICGKEQIKMMKKLKNAKLCNEH